MTLFCISSGLPACLKTPGSGLIRRQQGQRQENVGEVEGTPPPSALSNSRAAGCWDPGAAKDHLLRGSAPWKGKQGLWSMNIHWEATRSPVHPLGLTASLLLKLFLANKQKSLSLKFFLRCTDSSFPGGPLWVPGPLHPPSSSLGVPSSLNTGQGICLCCVCYWELCLWPLLGHKSAELR